ncbi:filamentous hemagglutinin N-terminal domain-containing protein [Chamaesiphon sp. VAR_48_metabat_403]|uniref:filamentous hemagglutinin N-terminal domain-containing protein n=1 Tax=Chamaesiphon sp. VAR_48_metabat_403 TaxID=2964700 RepID=UPI00286DA710|nr:filamentous hemagglutinin N-terminal domain-containing protein [Chamaesiphon sp. VAR_48_metabat_403]
MMNNSKLDPQHQISIGNIATASTAKLFVRSIFTIGVCAGFTIPASAQVTPGGDGTSVNKSGNTFNITGGTPSGTNLFHSFGTFGLQTNEIANFQPGATVTNILGRVNGNQPSIVDGKIQVTGGNAAGVNLYLMNPAGMIFGQNASLNVNGTFTATTANAIGFGNGNWFNAAGMNNYAGLTGTPEGFAFTNTPGSIFSAATFNSLASFNPLEIKLVKSVTLVGGTVIMTGDIRTGGGDISISTVQSGQYVKIKSDNNVLSLDVPIALPGNASNIPAEARAFTPPLLPALLTGTDGNLRAEANGVKIDNGVVKLVSENKAIQNRPISTGDIITKNISAGNLTLYADKGDIIVGFIDVTSLDVNASGLFRAVETLELNKLKNKDEVLVFASIRINSGSGIKITSSGTPFDTNVGENFPDGISGTSGEIVSQFNIPGNQPTRVVFTDDTLKDSELFKTSSPTRVATGTGGGGTDGGGTDGGGTDGGGTGGKTSNPDLQASRQKSKQDCTPNSTSVAANPTTDPTRAAGTSSPNTGDPCQTITGSASSILQILNNRN